MTWVPPESLEEKIKNMLIGKEFYIKRKYYRELKKGEKEIGLVPYLSNRKRISLDVGANKGIYTYVLLKHSMEVHAFEPNPKMFKVLEAWSKNKARLHQVALSDFSGEAELKIPKRKNGYSNQGGSLSAEKTAGQECGIVKVVTTRLDEMKIDNVGFIKIDVEGFEVQVLRGVEELIRKNKSNLLVEIEEKHNKKPIEEIIAEICEYGYQCFALCNGFLKNINNINLDYHHRNPKTRDDYIFNFIFLPV